MTDSKSDTDTKATEAKATDAKKSDQAKAEERSPEEIREDIEQTRDELGDTAAALAGKADVKGQAKAKVDDVKQTARVKKDEFTAKAKDMGSKAQDAAPETVGAGASSAAASAQENPVPLALAAAFAGGLLLGWILSR